jgi:hypothetical protein
VEQSPVLPLVAVNPMTAAVTGTGGATVTFSNEGSGFFGQAPPASAAPATSLAFSSRNAAKPARLAFQLKKDPTLQFGGFRKNANKSKKGIMHSISSISSERYHY